MIQKTKRRRPAGALVALAALAAMCGWSAGSASRPVAPPPSSVAVVNIEAFQDGLEEWKALSQDLVKRGDAYQKELDEAAKAFEDAKKALDLVPRGTPERDTKEIQAAELEARAKTKAALLQQRINVEKGDVIKKMYEKITAAITDYAGKEGFDLVLVDDRSVTLPPRGTDTQMAAVISQRRVLFASPRIDITRTIIDKMNAEWGSRKPGQQ